MDKKRIYFPPTSAQQRRLLFETWEATGSVAQACDKAHVCERTFYNWKPRFEAGGYAALEKPRSHARKHPSQTPDEIEEKVVAIRRQHPGRGKRRISDELAKENDWIPLVSPNTVRRILQDAGFWSKPDSPARKKGFQPAVRKAEKPGRTMNIDLCFVPERHEAEQKLPAVSGSSGRLVVERMTDEKTDETWPGRVWARSHSVTKKVA